MGHRHSKFPGFQQKDLFSYFPCAACLSVPSCESDGLEAGALGLLLTKGRRTSAHLDGVTRAKTWVQLVLLGWAFSSRIPMT